VAVNWILQDLPLYAYEGIFVGPATIVPDQTCLTWVNDVKIMIDFILKHFPESKIREL
jgi:hypothetical protein